jgi:hypothetical protein
MDSKGRIAITDTLGYDISFVRKIPTDEGYKIRILTKTGEVVAENYQNPWKLLNIMDRTNE